MLDASPQSGSSTGEHDTVSVSVSTLGLVEGEYEGQVVITIPAAAHSEAVDVFLSVVKTWHSSIGGNTEDRLYSIDKVGTEAVRELGSRRLQIRVGAELVPSLTDQSQQAGGKALVVLFFSFL